MHAFLIVGAEKETRSTAVDALLTTHAVAAHNRTPLARADDEASIGIAQVRSWQGQLALAPQGTGHTAGIIYDAHLLTQEAQQAMLKTIEEPPPSCIIILETPTPLALLPTILSRCWQITAHGNSTGTAIAQNALPLLQTATAGSVGEAMRASDTIATDKDAAATFVDQAIGALQQQLAERPSASGLLRAALQAKKQLAANVNPRLVIDAFLLSARAGQA